MGVSEEAQQSRRRVARCGRWHELSPSSCSVEADGETRPRSPSRCQLSARAGACRQAVSHRRTVPLWPGGWRASRRRRERDPPLAAGVAFQRALMWPLASHRRTVPSSLAVASAAPCDLAMTANHVSRIRQTCGRNPWRCEASVQPNVPERAFPDMKCSMNKPAVARAVPGMLSRLQRAHRARRRAVAAASTAKRPSHQAMLESACL